MRGDVPEQVRRSLELWVGCVAGALRDDDYVSKLQAAGFIEAAIEPWRIYQIDDARTFLAEAGVDVDGIASTLPYEVAPLPLRLTDQSPPQPGDLPRPEPPPELSEGPHLSYAIQWFSFAAIALVGAVILHRRDRHVTAAP